MYIYIYTYILLYNATKLKEAGNGHWAPGPGRDDMCSEIVRDYRLILEDPGIELVVINTPDHLHFEMCSQAIEAGKHVVIEKPFTLKAADADILIDLASQNRIILSVFHNRRWDGDFLTVKQLIDSGKLGTGRFFLSF